MRKLLTDILRLPGNPAWTGRILLLILLLAAVPRTVLLVRASDDDFLHNDGGEYMEISRQLARGNGFSLSFYRWHEVKPPDEPPGRLHPDLVRTPLFPLLGAALFLLPCPFMSSARVVSLILSLLAVYCVFLLGRELAGRACGIWSALFFAVYPYALYYSASWSTENLFLILLSLSFLFLLKAMRGKLSALAWCGLFLGLTALTRPTAVLLPAAFAALLWIRFMALGSLKCPKWKLKLIRPLPAGLLKWFGVFLLAAGLLLLPWMYRNRQVAGSWNPATYYDGYIFWLSFSRIMDETYRTLDTPEYAHAAESAWNEEHEYYKSELLKMGITDFLAAGKQWRKWGWERIRNSPGNALKLIGHRVLHYWRMCPNLVILNPWQILLIRLYFTVIFISALCGAFLLRRRTEVLIPLLPVFFGMAVSIPFLFVLRFRFPFFAPYICVLSGVFWTMAARNLLKRADKAKF